jgi:hypothetical protein
VVLRAAGAALVLLAALAVSGVARAGDDEGAAASDAAWGVKPRAPGESGPVAALPPEPASGLPLLISGAVVGGLGLVNGGTAWLCYADAFGAAFTTIYGSQRTCFIITMSIGAVQLATGVSLLAVGLVLRHRHDAWKKRVTAAFAPWLVPGGAGVALAGTF